jgi:tRNA(fMet)-specific endonuclease VapC
MIYLLDTNAIIALLTNKPTTVRERLRLAELAGNPIATSAIVLYELWYGVARSNRHADNVERLRVFLAGSIRVLPFEAEDAASAGELRAALEASGTPTGPYDPLIAAQALRTGATLVTANATEFRRVPGLNWEDWSTES